MSTYLETGAAVPRDWSPSRVADPPREKNGWIGRPVSRIDGPLKVEGKARFAAEVRRDGMVYAALAYATIAKGRIATLDTAAAEAAPGVVLVMTHRNMLRMPAPVLTMTAPRAAGPSTLTIMQDAEIHWNGQPIALVLAETREQAEHAASLIRATYDLESAITSFAAAQADARIPQNVVFKAPVIEIGDAAAALAAAAFKVDLTYHSPPHNHNSIELHGLTAWWEGDYLTVHDATGKVNATAWTLAQMFGIQEEQVRVLAPYVGGGFGGKGLWNHQVLAVAAAKLSGRPVRLELSREGVFRVVGGRAMTEQRVALGAKPDGTLAAIIHTGVSAISPYNNLPEPFTFATRHLYAADTIRIEQKVANMDRVANTFMRAPGESVGTYALECALDELAEAMQLDPIEFRRRIEPEKDPTSGHEFSSRHLVECYSRGAEKFGWRRRNPVHGARREGEWSFGMGVASATYPYARFPGNAARIRLGADGRAVVQIANHELGMGTATVQSQHAADLLGLPLDNVKFEYGDTVLPAGTSAVASSQTSSIAAAMIAAAEALNTELLRLAGNDSPLAGLVAADVEARDGALHMRADPSRFETYASILNRARRNEVACEAQAPAPTEVQQYSMHAWGAQFCEVKVNIVTGEVRIIRFLGAFDCGTILNPKTAASQFKGGIIMGIGLALMEETSFDERSGRIMNASLGEYHIPVHLDVPEIDIIWTEAPDPHSPLGARGIGEVGITGVGAAIANAVYNATGKRIRELPITLDKLL